MTALFPSPEELARLGYTDSSIRGVLYAREEG